MKVNECYKQVAQLGFEDSLESDERFVYTLNRALLQVALLRPATRACYIHHDPLTNAIQEESDTPLRVTKSAPLSFIASDVKAFYLEVLGIGSVYLDRKTAKGWESFYEEQFQSNGVYKALSGFIRDGDADVEGEVRLRIQTGYVCSVCNVAMYRDIYSDLKEEIPAYEAYTAYDVDAMVTDFMGLADPPIEANSFRHARQNVYDVENGRVILLARNAPGNYKVTYHHRPNEVIYANAVVDDETKIDLDEDLCALLPNLVASYVLLEDDPSMAQYYAALYQAAAQEIRMAAKNRKPVRVVNVTGW